MQTIRIGILCMFANAFLPKAGYLNPVDLQPREFNSPPDAVCNWVLAKRADIVELSVDAIVAPIRACAPIQIHCDGGFADGVRSAAFVVHAHDVASGSVTRLGYAGFSLPDARSAFHAEVVAMRRAVTWVKEALAHYRNTK